MANDLGPSCKDCKIEMQIAVYGLPGEWPLPEGQVSMGCVLPDLPARWVCALCGNTEPAGSGK